jgi:hypothetical protein
VRLHLGAAALCLALSQPVPGVEFTTGIKPVLEANCKACHDPANPKNRHNFLKAADAADVEARRGLWRNVATQLRNRTMPPGADAKISEQDRKMVADWIEAKLRAGGCTSGEYAGYVGPRRLNRREYHRTVRDLLGVELPIADMFPEDESGGAGFDTNGDTLYIPPMLLERHMDAARLIADRIIVARPTNTVVLSHEMNPRTAEPTGIRPARRLKPGEELSTTATAFTEGPYGLRISVERPRETPFTLEVRVDGVAAGKYPYLQLDKNGGATARSVTATLARGLHTITVVNGAEPVDFYSLTIEQQAKPATPDQAALHQRLLGVEPGQTPVDPRGAVKVMLRRLLPRAYRRPVEPAEIDRFLALYDRAAGRGDPFEEAVKFTLRGVLVSPRFLFRVEELPTAPGIHPLGQYDVASRLSYFLWGTMPDEELFRLAEAGRLQDPAVLAAQVDRMLDDPRSRAFAGAFVGQWLGTKEIGGRAMPLLTELQHFYTPDVAADLREQPELFFHYMLAANRPVLDVIDARYTFLTKRLVKYYQLEGKAEVRGTGFERVDWPDERRAGVLGFASILGMSSHYKQASPVLRGAWVLDTLLGTPVPPPPPGVPQLEAAKDGAPMPMKAMLARHRADPACASCHNLMDPIGMGLENFDWMGRWRDHEANGDPVDASGNLPGGEQFRGPAGLRAVLLARKDDFVRQIASKMLGYATGRGQQDGDQCAIQAMATNLERNGYAIRTLIRDVATSAAFRKVQIEAAGAEPVPTTRKAPRRLLGTK